MERQRRTAGRQAVRATGDTIMKLLHEAITKHPFFEGMKPQHFAVLASGAKAATFEAGDLIFREGEPANQFFLIESGHVALEVHEPANGTIRVQTLGPGEVLGWSWLFPPFVWHFQARAVDSVKVVVLSGAHLLAAAERDHEFGHDLMKRVTQVLMHRLQAVRKQLVATQYESALEG
jgi:CRP/FNR family cyclic AMP-dependent transcriptional regulator